MIPFYRLMLITQKQNKSTTEYLDFIKKCADGGITSLQLREKQLSFHELIMLGEQLIKILEPYKIPLVINDFPEIAKHLNTPFIHIGQHDESISDTVKIIPNAQIGVSIESLEDMEQANKYELAYVTASAVFPSDNKSNLKKIWKLTGIKQLSQISKNPLTAIGGVTLNNLESIIFNGAQGIALIGALHNCPTPYETSKLFRNLLDSLL